MGIEIEKAWSLRVVASLILAATFVGSPAAFGTDFYRRVTEVRPSGVFEV